MKERLVLHARIVSGRGGGPEKTILASPRHLRGSGYAAVAAYLHAPGDEGIHDLERRAREAEAPFVALPDAGAVDFAALRELERLCRERDVAIWHGHDYKSNLYGLILRRRLRRAGRPLALVTTVHGWVQKTWKTPLYWAVDRACIRRYEQVIAVSADLERECLRFGVARERLTFVPNAIDTGMFRRDAPPSDSPLRAEVPAGRLIVGAVGRLSPEKGFDLLIGAARDARARGVDLEVWIVGEGPERAALEALAASAPVRLLGWRADVRELFAAFDLFCLSSLREGLPNVVLEAMACEVPVLATRSGGMDEFARDGEDCLLVPPGDRNALAAGLTRLTGDAALRTRLARTARARIEREFSFARRMERVVAVYERLARP